MVFIVTSITRRGIKYPFSRMGMILTASWEIHRVRDCVVAVNAQSYEDVSGRVGHRGLKQILSV
jgi:hypothetical protein